MELSGIIYSIESENVFTIIQKGKKIFLYLQKNLIKKYDKYLDKGVKVIVHTEDEKSIHGGFNSYQIEYFILISKRTERDEVIYYDIDRIRKGIRTLFKKFDSIMFVDFEMNMQDYVPIPDFSQEIIETGLVVTNNTGAVRVCKHYYTWPKKVDKITNRTIKFLHYDLDVFKKSSISFEEMYNDIKQINEKYHPAVIVWGRSDIVTYKKCEELSGLEPLNLNFVNLLQLIINYYNLKQSPGLFSMYEELYGEKLPDQEHDSLEDAKVTKDVFFKFKETILG